MSNRMVDYLTLFVFVQERNLSNWHNFWEEFKSEFGAVEKEVARDSAPVSNSLVYICS